MQGQFMKSFQLTRLSQLKKPRRDRFNIVRAQFFILRKLTEKL